MQTIYNIMHCPNLCSASVFFLALIFKKTKLMLFFQHSFYLSTCVYLEISLFQFNKPHFQVSMYRTYHHRAQSYGLVGLLGGNSVLPVLLPLQGVMQTQKRRAGGIWSSKGNLNPLWFFKAFKSIPHC